MKTHQLETALDALDRLDPDLKSARAEFGNPPDRFEVASFSTLVRIILGYIVFDEVPSHIQLIGAAIIVGSCMFIVLREFQLSRKSS